MRRIAGFFWRDKVFLIASSLALLSLFFFPPTLSTVKAINFDVIIIMFSLMLSIAGMGEANLFTKIAITLTSKVFTIRYVGLIIVMATFFIGMWITNDAVLLTLVPFTLIVMKQTQSERYSLTIVILQTFAANMGSSLTPMGDPQNIYLYQLYGLGFGEFMGATWPITVTAFILIVGTTYFLLPNTFIKPVLVEPKLDNRKLIIEIVLFLIVLLVILRVLPAFWALIAAIVITAAFYPHLFQKVDYHLLLTFISFFIFTYNISRWQPLVDFSSKFLDSSLKVYLSGLMFSQFMSNVPAAVLLSTFTPKTYWQSLVQGVNVGAMGSIIGSLASLITLKFVLREFPREGKNYLLTYTFISVVYILIISGVLLIIY
ncbi:MAG: SLC13 family permease [Candidatus Izemoplasmatales bacterium]